LVVIVIVIAKILFNCYLIVIGQNVIDPSQSATTHITGNNSSLWGLRLALAQLPAGINTDKYCM